MKTPLLTMKSGLVGCAPVDFCLRLFGEVLVDLAFTPVAIGSGAGGHHLKQTVASGRDVALERWAKRTGPWLLRVSNPVDRIVDNFLRLRHGDLRGFG